MSRAAATEGLIKKSYNHFSVRDAISFLEKYDPDQVVESLVIDLLHKVPARNEAPK